MKDLLALTRMMKLYYHHLHNIAHGPCFSADHELMSDFYTQLDKSYDSLVERHIGLGGTMDTPALLEIITEAHSVLNSIPDTDDMITYFYHSMSLEASLRAEIEAAISMSSAGTENLLAALADESEQREYMLKQRVK